MFDKIKVVYTDSQARGTCYLTSIQSKQFNLSNTSEYITLTLGSAIINLKKIIVDNDEMGSDKLYLSSDVENQLYIEQGTVLQIRKLNDEHLEIGPYIGIFINQEKIDLLNSGENITEYAQFYAACKSLYGICCFFSIENIDWGRKLIQGLVRDNGSWVTKVRPIPKIIYDRNVENNCRAESIELRKRLAYEHKILNNIPKLAKWETINALKKNPKLFNLIPETIQYSSIKDVENILEKYSSVYLKPDSLSKGKGIYKISKTFYSQYKVEYRTVEENHVLSLKRLEDLNQLLNRYSKMGGGYIIQREINKALFRGSTFDLRILFQKDYTGIWQPSGIVGRIAAKGSVITSPRSGGIVEDFSTILREVFREDTATKYGIYKQLVYFGKEICCSIEEKFGNCVELGLDMAIDVNRKIWVIEVNGKPLKVSLKRLGNSEIMSRCNRRPIEYAVKLAGFVSGDTNLC